MQRTVLALLLAALATPALAASGPLADRKPGLWEIEYSARGTGGEDARRMEEMRQRMAAMPPEKRAQMEAYMKRGGTGMTIGPDGTPTMVTHVCLTPEQIAEESARGFTKGMSEHRDCTPQVDRRSATEMHVHAVCRGPDATSTEVDARIYDIAPDHYAVEMDAKSNAKGNMHMSQKARWVGTDCKGVQ